MALSYTAGLERNIRIQYLFRTLNKRVYLPLIAVYAVSVADLTLAQFGWIASITAVISLILEVPSGYISDRLGHKQALILGQGLMTLAPLGYVFSPDFMGVLIGSAGYFGGYAFLSGTQEAFLHETMIELDREKDYVKIVGRIQTISLLVNVLLIATIPLTYTVDPRLPFLIGSILIGINFIAAFFLTTTRKKESVAGYEELSFSRLLQVLYVGKHFPLFMLLGVSIAAANKIPELKEIYMLSYGIPIPWLGFIAAVTGLLAAGVSYNLDRISKLPEQVYFGISIFMLSTFTIISGFLPNRWLAIAFVAFLVIYTRNDSNLTRGYILKNCPTRELKATYLSMLAFMEALNGIWIPLLLGYLSAELGVRLGYTYFGGVIFIITATLYCFYLIRGRSLENNRIAG